MLYHQEQPFGQWRGDFRAAQIVYAIYDAMTGKAPPITSLMPLWATEQTTAQNDDVVSEDDLAELDRYLAQRRAGKGIRESDG